MPKPTPPYVVRETTRHGRLVWFYRRGKGRRVRLPDRFGTDKWWDAYAKARLGLPIDLEPEPPRVATNAPTWVYFMRCADRVKIGYSTDPRKRRSQLATGLPDRIVVAKAMPGGPELERAMHDRFAEFHLNGEWFRCAGSLADFINAPSKYREPDEVVF